MDQATFLPDPLPAALDRSPTTDATDYDQVIGGLVGRIVGDDDPPSSLNLSQLSAAVWNGVIGHITVRDQNFHGFDTAVTDINWRIV